MGDCTMEGCYVVPMVVYLVWSMAVAIVMSLVTGTVEVARAEKVVKVACGVLEGGETGGDGQDGGGNGKMKKGKCYLYTICLLFMVVVWN